jgi:hemerythrin superfamily protein
MANTTTDREEIRRWVEKRDGDTNRPASRHAARDDGGGAAAAEPIDALAMLESQHRAVEELFLELDKGRDGAAFRRKFLELADLLAMHAAIEERHFYPAVKAADTEEELHEFVQDHLEVKRVLATLLATSQSDRDLMSELEELEGLTEEHVIEEEHDLFPKVRELMDRDQLIGIAQEMAATMVELQQEGEPHQHVPEQTDEPAPI